jgi:hypothetical protein
MCILNVKGEAGGKKKQRPADMWPSTGAKLRTTVRQQPKMVGLTAAKRGKKIVGVPFSDVSFRAFTASPNVEKGTPTDQPFDNRSIA